MIEIKLKRSAVQSAVPVAGDLAGGEVAINTFDGAMFIKKDNNVVVQVGGSDADNEAKFVTREGGSTLQDVTDRGTTVVVVTDTVIDLSLWVDVERRGILRVERADGAVVGAGALELKVRADDIDDVILVDDALHGFLRDHSHSGAFFVAGALLVVVGWQIAGGFSGFCPEFSLLLRRFLCFEVRASAN